MERVSHPHRFSSSLVERREIAPRILEVCLQRPPAFHFIPGQFVRFVMDGYQRDYTIVSHPDAGTVDLCIALVDGGRFSDIMAGAAPGDRFQLSGPHGHFIFQESALRPVFVATGTGVAPFVAFCRKGVPDAMLLHGVSHPDQLIYRHLLASCLDAYVPCISRAIESRGCLEESFAGRVTAYLQTRLATGTYDFYLCGKRAMIRDVTALIDDRFAGSRLFIENFD